MLERYLEFVQKRYRPALLDLGPVCGGNISLFAEKAGVVYVCDLLRRLSGNDPVGQPPGTVESILNYSFGSFDGIHLWDIPGHVDDTMLRRIALQCRKLLKARGLVMVLAGGSPVSEPFENFLAVNKSLSVNLIESKVRRFPHVYRSNRDIAVAMQPLEQYASFVCSNGWREFLFR
jgi:hypothetical protein